MSPQPATPLDLALPRVWCDFNAVGLGPEPGDPCYYSFAREQVSSLPALLGRNVVLYQENDGTTFVACEALIESFTSGRSPSGFAFCGFRARPLPASWREGPGTTLGITG
jgi:hypothetical protein